MPKVSGYVCEIHGKDMQNRVEFWGSVLSEEQAIKQVEELNKRYQNWTFFYDSYWIGEQND